MAEKKNENMTGKSSFKSGDVVKPLTYMEQKMNNTKVSRFISTKELPVNEKENIAKLSVSVFDNGDVINLVDIWGNDNIQLSSRIVTQYDMSVMDAAVSILYSGSEIFTAEDIVKVMSGNPKTRPTEKKVQKVRESIRKLRNIMISIDYTEEYNKFYAKNEKDKAERRVRESYLMPLDKDTTIYAANGKKIIAYKFLIEPALYSYASFNKQVISVPKELMDTSDYFKDDEESILIKRYVIRRVAQMAANNSLKSNRISYLWYNRKASPNDRERGLLPELGYKPEDYSNWSDKKMRINRVVKGTLQSLKDKGAIKDFSEYRESKDKNRSKPVLGYQVELSDKDNPLRIGKQ